jgi:putative ABC transport system ATP-binding protein
MIRLNQISVTFGQGTALENKVLQQINLTIAPSEFITVIGSNGAGKSTLLGLLAGTVSPQTGDVFFDNENITAMSVEKRAARIGYVYQDPRLGTCEALTIEENLAFAMQRGKKRGLRSALHSSLKNHFQSLLTDLNTGLEDRLKEPVAMLSGGQRQVLSLIMATLQPPELLLLDEHTAALDPNMAQSILTLTERIVKQHKLTTFMVTHNMAHALQMGNRTLLMQQGRIVRDLSQAERSRLTPGELVGFL